MNWATIFQYAISGAIVSWPGIVLGFWLNAKKTRAHVDRATERQTSQVATMTDNQTGILLDRLGGAYQEHGDSDPQDPG